MRGCLLLLSLILLLCFSPALADDKPASKTSILDKLNELEERYIQVKIKIGNLKKQKQQLDNQLKDSQKQIDSTKKQQVKQQRLLVKRIRESHKLSDVSGWEYMLSSRDFSDFILRSHYLKKLWDSDRKLIEAYSGGIRTISKNQQEIVKKQKKLTSLIGRLKKEKRELSKRMKERKTFIDKVRTEPKLKKQARKEFAKAGEKLNKRVASIATKPAPKKQKHVAFSKMKGKMPCPVKAKIEQGFGEVENDEAKIFHGGLDFRAKNGTPVKLPADGMVIFSGRFRGFGNLLVIDHGQKFYTLYAHLKELLLPKGQKVSKGQIIGHVGDSGSIKGSYLYFELRYKGKAINPVRWFTCQ